MWRMCFDPQLQPCFPTTWPLNNHIIQKSPQAICKQTTSMMEHKVFHEATLKQEKYFKSSTFHCRNMALCHTRQGWTVLQKCEFNLNQTNDSEDEAELSIAKDVSDKLK